MGKKKLKVVIFISKVIVAQSCPTLCNPMVTKSMEFSRPEYWSGQPFPSPRSLPHRGIKPRSPALQADSLPAEPQEKSFLSWGLTYFCPEKLIFVISH